MESHLSWADGVLVVYSITDQLSYELASSLAHRLSADTLPPPSSEEESTLSTTTAADKRHSYWSASTSSSCSSSSSSSQSSSSSTESVDTLTDNGSTGSLLDGPGTRRPKRAGSSKRHCVVLVGNKSDLVNERRVRCRPTSGADDVVIETSARDGGPEIQEAFSAVCRLVLESRDRRHVESRHRHHHAAAPSSPTPSTSTPSRLGVFNRLVKRLSISRSGSFIAGGKRPGASNDSQKLSVAG